MRATTPSRLPMMMFVLALVGSTSAVASAVYFRVAVGTNSFGYGGGGFGCLPSGSNYDCPVPDNDYITSWSTANATVNYQNSNATQPAYACWSYPNALGAACGTSTSNNCPAHGVCSYTLDTSGWGANSTAYKWIQFQNLTSGAVIAGYTITD